MKINKKDFKKRERQYKENYNKAANIRINKN